MWSVTTPTGSIIMKFARHVWGYQDPSTHDDPYQQDFLTHYAHPTRAGTGERLNWLRLPVLDLEWNAKTADTGGFIQEATGWKPSPLQPTMDEEQIGRAAGL
ncbi:hypothetical protein [Streptomyces sp. NPDC059575]|uniref:hypothetical protein n=1 Tax=Streptomyces sp. NPDC059575 TaxID=3346872 RepID=UPI00368ED036